MFPIETFGFMRARERSVSFLFLIIIRVTLGNRKGFRIKYVETRLSIALVLERETGVSRTPFGKKQVSFLILFSCSGVQFFLINSLGGCDV